MRKLDILFIALLMAGIGFHFSEVNELKAQQAAQLKLIDSLSKKLRSLDYDVDMLEPRVLELENKMDEIY